MLETLSLNLSNKKGLTIVADASDSLAMSMSVSEFAFEVAPVLFVFLGRDKSET